MDFDEILKVCALSRLNAPETRAERHAYTTARDTLSSLVERVSAREHGPAAPASGDPGPGKAPLRSDEPRPHPLPGALPELAPEFRARLLLVPPIL